MMHEYKLPSTFFAKVRTKVLLWTIIMGSLALAAGVRIGMAWIALLDDESNLPSSVLFVTILVALIALLVGIRIGLRRVERSWASYRLILDENSIRRVQDGYPEVTIQTNEISKITEMEERGILVHSMSPYTYISIPRALEEYSEVRSDLAKKHAIESTSRTRGKVMPILTITSGLLTPVALLITFLATNKYVIVITGSLLFIWLLVSTIVILRSGSTSTLAKRNAWLILLPLLAIAIRVAIVVASW